MQALAVIFAVSCLLGHAVAVVDPIDCPGRPSSRCDAVTGLRIVTTEGTCSGTSQADCKVWTSSQDVFVDEFKTWFANPDKICDRGFARARARAVARAIAKVFANTFVRVTCTGTGFACGRSFAGGEGFAASVAEAVAFAAADASVQVGSDDINAFCFSDIRAIGAAFASASTTAFSQTCTSGGTAVDWENNFVEAINEVVATAFSSAFASRCITPGDTSARSRCFGESSVTRDSLVVGRGDFCADVGPIPPCPSAGASLCCGSSNPICFSRSRCAGCALPWNRSPSNPKLWNRANGSQCLCV